MSARSILVAAAAATLTPAASATWSIVLVDLRTGEIAVGSASCVPGLDMKAATPVLIPGVGAAIVHGSMDQTGQIRVFVRDHLVYRTGPEQMLTLLAQFDPGYQTRAYAITDTLGRAVAFPGLQASNWKGGRVGMAGDILYAIQGGALTGEPVVTEAVRAVIETPGDLADKLMASMEAARRMGGDGRCSCPGNPTGCGSPPPNFTKTAHIAYMLIAREGDTHGCNGIYRAGLGAFGIAAADLDGDGRIDLVTANPGTPHTVSILLNNSRAGGPATFEQALTVPNAAGSRWAVVGDVNGDGILDIVTANATAHNVSVLVGAGGVGFQPAVTYATGNDPQDVVLADVNGDGHPDIITANFSSNGISILLNDGAGGFLPADTIAAGGRIQGIVALDINGNGHQDLAYPARDLNAVIILTNNGAGAFQFGDSIPVANSPIAVVAADFDGDGRTDLATISTGERAATILLNQGGTFQRQDIPRALTPTRLAAGDVDGDGFPDLVLFQTGTPDTGVLLNNGDGSLREGPQSHAGLGQFRPVLADLNGNGLADIAAAAPGRNSAVVIENHGGRFNSGIGCATGDLFMDFNVAFATALDPDPVFTLQQMLADWRADLETRPDAVVSRVEVDPPIIAGNGSSIAAMTITLLDWRGEPATHPIASIDVMHAPGGDGLSTIGAPVRTGPGVYTVELTEAVGPGTDLFRIRADDGVRPVYLMPDPALEIACGADCDTNGRLDFFDFLCFQNAFLAGDPYADCDGSGALDFFDFLCFQNEFLAGCP